jgi:hypothetical protein
MRPLFKDVAPIRMGDVTSFLRTSGRTERCPFCDYAGDWEFHIQIDKNTGEPEDDPLMCVFSLPLTHGENTQECVALTCPKCAHFSMLDIYLVKRHKFAKQSGGGPDNG